MSYPLLVFLTPWVIFTILSEIVPWDRNWITKGLFAIGAIGIVLYQLDYFLGI